jgi:hypothetical protein
VAAVQSNQAQSAQEEVQVKQYEQPLEDLSFLEVPLFHGSRDMNALLKQGIRRDPAIMLSESLYAWSGCRSGSFCDAGGINWKGYVWASWKTLPLHQRRVFQQRIGKRITTANDLGREVALFWATSNRNEAIDYMGFDQHQPPLAFDPTKLPGVLWAFLPDISSKREVVLVMKAGPPVRIQPALIKGWRKIR